MSESEFIDRQYARHAAHFYNDLVDEERIRISNSWFDESTADFWRHARAYECASHLTGTPGQKWLTVGDGRWGLDAIRIRKRGIADVLPTDISEALLKEAKERKLIDKYAVENAERLSFADASFDYVFCKESLHHFPRPYVALYEMIRVARKGVFIVEPNDAYGVFSASDDDVTARGVSAGNQTDPAQGGGPGVVLVRWLRSLAQRVARRLLLTGGRVSIRYNEPGWESSGNFMYAFSRRETEKIALGLNMPQMVFKGLNDHYVAGCEFEPADATRSKVFKEIVDIVGAKDNLCKAGLSDYSLIMIGLMLQPLNAAEHKKFEATGWDIRDLPSNPYLPREGM